MNNFNVKNSSKAFLWSIFLPQIASIILVMIFSLFFEDLKTLQNSLVYVFSMTTLAQICFFAIYLFFAKKNKINVIDETKKSIKLVKPKNVFICLLISVIAVFGLFMFVGIFTSIAEKIGFKESPLGLPINTFGWFLVNVGLSAVLPAIMEELVFRGIIFKGLKKHGFWFGAIVSSLMFMIVHLSLGSTIYPLIMGIIFCLVVEKTGSVIYSSIIHFCNNFIVLLIDYISTTLGKNILPVASVWWHYVLVVIVAVCAVGLIYYIIKKWLTKCTESTTENEKIIIEADNNVVANQNKKERLTVTYALIIGCAFWLLMVISSLV